jgi:hypothetical protein
MIGSLLVVLLLITAVYLSRKPKRVFKRDQKGRFSRKHHVRSIPPTAKFIQVSERRLIRI